MCNCYVRGLSPEIQFVVRYGSHDYTCPVYRPSLDPVDAVADSAFRQKKGK